MQNTSNRGKIFSHAESTDWKLNYIIGRDRIFFLEKNETDILQRLIYLHILRYHSRSYDGPHDNVQPIMIYVYSLIFAFSLHQHSKALIENGGY